MRMSLSPSLPPVAAPGPAPTRTCCPGIRDVLHVGGERTADGGESPYSEETQVRLTTQDAATLWRTRSPYV